MKIVIDIPEHYIENNIKRELPITLSEDNIVAILPKGHGDLKDADKLKHAFSTWRMAVQGNFTETDIASIICNSPTILEADKEVDNEDSN